MFAHQAAVWLGVGVGTGVAVGVGAPEQFTVGAVEKLQAG